MLINCKDRFNEESLGKLVETLNEGKDVQIYIESNDHNSDSIQSSHYASELYSIYGDRLKRIKNSKCYHSYVLKDNKNV